MEQEFMKKIMGIKIRESFEKEVLAMVRRGLSKGSD